MKVLYATDGFEAAEAAARLIGRVADRDKVELTVMSVTHSGATELEHAALLLDPVELRRKDTIALIDHWVAHFRDEGFRATGRTAEGRPAEEIVRAVDQDWYDLVVLGSGRGTWLGQRLLGSVSTHVLHTSPTSVLVVHGATGPREDPRILVAVDGSRSCEFAARAVRDLAPTSAAIRVVSCYAPITVFAVPGTTVMTVPTGEAHERAVHAAERLADHFATEFKDAGYIAESAALWGQPQEQILKEAEAFGAHLVVVGSRGLGAVRRALMGSVSDQVARHAPATLVGRHYV